jgi:hypothetical protein
MSIGDVRRICRHGTCHVPDSANLILLRRDREGEAEVGCRRDWQRVVGEAQCEIICVNVIHIRRTGS